MLGLVIGWLNNMKHKFIRTDKKDNMSTTCQPKKVKRCECDFKTWDGSHMPECPYYHPEPQALKEKQVKDRECECYKTQGHIVVDGITLPNSACECLCHQSESEIVQLNCDCHFSKTSEPKRYCHDWSCSGFRKHPEHLQVKDGGCECTCPSYSSNCWAIIDPDCPKHKTKPSEPKIEPLRIQNTDSDWSAKMRIEKKINEIIDLLNSEKK
jgi:hypothetical protein